MTTVAARKKQPAKKKGASTEAPAFSFSRGSHVPVAHVKALVPVMRRLASAGRGTAKDLLAEASNPRSPAHKCFEWDDSAAAHKYRLSQASDYWSALRVVVETDGEPILAPAFIRVNLDSAPEYRAVADVIENADWTAQMLAQAKRELESWRKRYAMLRAVGKLAGVFGAIDDDVGSAAE